MCLCLNTFFCLYPHGFYWQRRLFLASQNRFESGLVEISINIIASIYVNLATQMLSFNFVLINLEALKMTILYCSEAFISGLGFLVLSAMDIGGLWFTAAQRLFHLKMVKTHFFLI